MERREQRQKDRWREKRTEAEGQVEREVNRAEGQVEREENRGRRTGGERREQRQKDRWRGK